MKKILQILMLLAMAFAAENLVQTNTALNHLEQSVIRLHILANSDATADQMQKLLVRDALLTQSETWIPAGADRETGYEALQLHLPDIQHTAEETLRASGCMDEVTVSLGKSEFPARTYGDITLPAGEYDALRVEIGAAEGQNWWCVMYPALCLPAACEADTVLDDDAYDLAVNAQEYEVRLKCVDAARAVCKWAKTKMQGAVSAIETASCNH